MYVSKGKMALVLSLFALLLSVTWGSTLALLGLLVFCIVSLVFSLLGLIRNRKSHERIDMKLVIAVFLSLVAIVFLIGSVVAMYELWTLGLAVL